jgi:hypothetical protein
MTRRRVGPKDSNTWSQFIEADDCEEESVKGLRFLVDDRKIKETKPVRSYLNQSFCIDTCKVPYSWLEREIAFGKINL